MKSLPLSYNRDMQEDKSLLFDAVETLSDCLDVYCDMIPKIMVREEEMYRAAVTGYLNATDLADYLAAKGMPFREAHHVAGAAVAYAIQRQKELTDLDLTELQKFSLLISVDIFESLTPKKMIDRRTSLGGTATENVKQAIAAAYLQLEEQRLESDK